MRLKDKFVHSETVIVQNTIDIEHKQENSNYFCLVSWFINELFTAHLASDATVTVPQPMSPTVERMRKHLVTIRTVVLRCWMSLLMTITTTFARKSLIALFTLEGPCSSMGVHVLVFTMFLIEHFWAKIAFELGP